jgi:hypothetical protein
MESQKKLVTEKTKVTIGFRDGTRENGPVAGDPVLQFSL